MDDPQKQYRELLAKEQEAWERLLADREGDSQDPALMAEWLTASRATTVARDASIDRMLGEGVDVTPDDVGGVPPSTQSPILSRGAFPAADRSRKRGPPLKRIGVDDLPVAVQAVVRDNAIGAERANESDFSVCLVDQKAGTYACVSAQDLQQLSRLAVNLVDTGFSLGETVPEGCGCDYVFDHTR